MQPPAECNSKTQKPGHVRVNGISHSSTKPGDDRHFEVNGIPEWWLTSVLFAILPRWRPGYMKKRKWGFVDDQRVGNPRVLIVIHLEGFIVLQTFDGSMITSKRYSPPELFGFFTFIYVFTPLPPPSVSLLFFYLWEINWSLLETVESRNKIKTSRGNQFSLNFKLQSWLIFKTNFSVLLKINIPSI